MSPDEGAEELEEVSQELREKESRFSDSQSMYNIS